MSKLNTKSLILCSLFAALIAVGAFMKIPVPMVPFTLQVLCSTLAGLLLGPRLGVVSVGIYIALRLSWASYFYKWWRTKLYYCQPTFGYLIGFSNGCICYWEYCSQNQKCITKKINYSKLSWLSNSFYHRNDICDFIVISPIYTHQLLQLKYYSIVV